MKILKLLKYLIFLFLLTVVLFSANAQSAVSDNIIFEVETAQSIQISASETIILIGLANNYINNRLIFLKNINIQKGNKIIKNIPVGKYLFSQKKKIEKSEVLINELENTADEKRVKEILKEIGELKKEIRSQSFSGEIFLNISDFVSSPRAGEQYVLTISADLLINGKPEKTTREVVINFISPLPAQEGWHVGDGHVHSGHSELDGAYWFKRWRLIVEGPSIDDQTLAAKNFGLGWLIFTDHEDMLNAEEWLQEVEEAGVVQENRNIQVMVGEEVGSVAPKISQGHYLAYGISSYVDANPFSGKDSVDKTKDAGGFGFIAHPDSRLYEWKDWTVEGYTGYQILAEEERTAERKTLQRWNEHLDSNKKPVATGNSDSHWQEGVGSTRTYLKIRGEVNHQSIYNALKNGNAVVTNGPLLTFTINDAIIGETTNVPPGEQAVLNIQWTSNEDFGPMKEIFIISKGGEILSRLTKEIQTLSGTTTIAYSITEPTYFRLVGQTAKGNIVYTNPIWVTNDPLPPSNRWSEPINISNTLGSSRSPSSVSDRFGQIYIVWSDNTSGNYEILYTKWDGIRWSSPLDISRTPTPSLQPSIVIDSLGNLSIVWVEELFIINAEIFYKEYRNNLWTENINISNNGFNSVWPAIAIDNTNRTHVVWMDNATNNYEYEILYRTREGNDWSHPLNVSNTTTYSGVPAIAIDVYNQPHIVWLEYLFGFGKIIYIFRKDEQWSSSIDVSTINNYYVNWSGIVVDDSNNVHITWQGKEVNNYDNYEIFYRKKEGNDWLDIINISKSEGVSGYPTIAYDRFGGVHIAWTEASNFNQEILYSYSVKGDEWASSEIVSNEINYPILPSISIGNQDTLNINIIWAGDLPSLAEEIFFAYKQLKINN